MAISFSLITTRLNTVLQDALCVRWTDAERISWINEAAKAIVTRRPDTGAITQQFTCVSGSKQVLDDTIFKLLDVARNLNNQGNPTTAVMRTERAQLDRIDPNWHTATAAATKQFCYDDKIQPNEFFVYPQALSGAFLQIVVSKFPADIATTADTLNLPNECEEALLNYVLYRCFTKESESGNTQLAASYYSAFLAALGQVATGA